MVGNGPELFSDGRKRGSGCLQRVFDHLHDETLTALRKSGDLVCQTFDF